MRKASRILYLIAAILSIFVAVNALIGGIVLIVIPNSEAFIAAFIEAYNNDPVEGLTVLQALEALQAALISCGIFCIIAACFAGFNSFLGFKAHHEAKPSKALNILNIVFGVLSCVEVNIVGAIFALVADGQEERQPKAVEEKK